MKARFSTPRICATALFVANGLAFGTWAASIPRLAERLSLAPLGLAGAIVALSLASIAMMPFLGRLIERRGARTVALAGSLLVPVLLPLAIEAGSYVQLVAVGIALGAAIGSMDVAMNALAVEAERRENASWMSQMHGLWSVGTLGGSLLTTALIASGVPLPSVVTAVAIGVALVVAARAGAGLSSEATAAAAPPAGATIAPDARTTLIVIGLLAACALVVEGAMGDWCALYLRVDLRASAVAAPLGYAAFAGAMMAGRFTGDAFVERFGRAAVLGGSAALAALGLAAGLSAPSPISATIAFALAGLGVANVTPTLFGAAGRMAAGGGLALVTGIGYTAFLLGPGAIGAVARTAGLRQALAIAVVCALVVAAAVAIPRVRLALART